MPKSTIIQPPSDITGEAMGEWNRVCEALKKMGRKLREADRSILATYCRTWIINRDCFVKVQAEGAIITHINGAVGPSPHYRAFKETTIILRNLAGDLGLTPASRNFDVAEKKDKPLGLPKY